MAGRRRTNYEIKTDYENLKKASKTAKSWKELGEMVGLSYAQIKTTLSSHPVVEKRIRRLLEENAKQTVEEEREQNSCSKEDEQKTKKLPNKVVTQINQERKKVEGIKLDYLESGKNYVLDTCMAGVIEIEELISSITQKNSKIIITSIVNDELEKLQNKADIHTAAGARKILRLVAMNPQKFEVVFIKKQGVPDDCIVDYCLAHKNKVVLLTADKHMAIDARAKGVKVIYFPHTYSINNIELYEGEESISSQEKVDIDIISFRSTGISIDQSEFKKRTQFIMVKNGYKIYLKGPLQLDCDYEILIAKKEWDKIIFTHYKIVRRAATKHAVIIYSEEGSIDNVLQNEVYDDFNFMAKKYFDIK